MYACIDHVALNDQVRQMRHFIFDLHIKFAQKSVLSHSIPVILLTIQNIFVFENDIVHDLLLLPVHVAYFIAGKMQAIFNAARHIR